MERLKTEVTVIGGGVVGSAILHMLSRYHIQALLVEKEPDLCEGISKSNSAIIHTGFDAPVGSQEALALARARQLWPELIANHQLAFEARGAIMVALTEEDVTTIQEKYIPQAKLNEVEVKWLSPEEVLADNPVVNPACLGGLLIPDEGIINPFEAVYRFAEVAMLNGAEVILGNGVTAITPAADTLSLTLADGSVVETEYIINAAGLYADEVARMVGDESFTITPRKGQFIVTKDPVGIRQIILPVPSKTTKGKLLIPAVFKGHLIGPTAEDITDKTDRSITPAGLLEVQTEVARLVPESQYYSTVKQYAGLRSVGSEDDYIIRPSTKVPTLIHVAGIRSTGLSGSPGIAVRVKEVLESIKGPLTPKGNWQASLPPQSVKETTNESICLSRLITRQQVIAALKRPLVPRTIDGFKRRLEIGLGDCQGSCCVPKLVDILREEGVVTDIPLKGHVHSEIGYPLKEEITHV